MKPSWIPQLGAIILHAESLWHLANLYHITPFALDYNDLKKLFIYFWLRWVFIAACGLSLVVASGGYSSLRCVGVSHCSGFSCCRAWALGTQVSVAVAHGLSSCGSRA